MLGSVNLVYPRITYLIRPGATLMLYLGSAVFIVVPAGVSHRQVTDRLTAQIFPQNLSAWALPIIFPPLTTIPLYLSGGSVPHGSCMLCSAGCLCSAKRLDACAKIAWGMRM